MGLLASVLIFSLWPSMLYNRLTVSIVCMSVLHILALPSVWRRSKRARRLAQSPPSLLDLFVAKKSRHYFLDKCIEQNVRMARKKHYERREKTPMPRTMRLPFLATLPCLSRPYYRKSTRENIVSQVVGAHATKNIGLKLVCFVRASHSRYKMDSKGSNWHLDRPPGEGDAPYTPSPSLLVLCIQGTIEISALGVDQRPCFGVQRWHGASRICALGVAMPMRLGGGHMHMHKGPDVRSRFRKHQNELATNARALCHVSTKN